MLTVQLGGVCATVQVSECASRPGVLNFNLKCSGSAAHLVCAVQLVLLVGVLQRLLREERGEEAQGHDGHLGGTKEPRRKEPLERAVGKCRWKHRGVMASRDDSAVRKSRWKAQGHDGRLIGEPLERAVGKPGP